MRWCVYGASLAANGHAWYVAYLDVETIRRTQTNLTIAINFRHTAVLTSSNTLLGDSSLKSCAQGLQIQKMYLASHYVLVGRVHSLSFTISCEPKGLCHCCYWVTPSKPLRCRDRISYRASESLCKILDVKRVPIIWYAIKVH